MLTNSLSWLDEGGGAPLRPLRLSAEGAFDFHVGWHGRAARPRQQETRQAVRRWRRHLIDSDRLRTAAERWAHSIPEATVWVCPLPWSSISDSLLRRLQMPMNQRQHSQQPVLPTVSRWAEQKVFQAGELRTSKPQEGGHSLTGLATANQWQPHQQQAYLHHYGLTSPSLTSYLASATSLPSLFSLLLLLS